MTEKINKGKLKIVMMIANSGYTPYFRYFAEMASKEGKIDFTFIFLHLEEPKIINEVKSFGVNCIWLPFDYRKEKKIQYLKLTFKLFRIFRKLKPDIVHTNLFDDSLPGLLAAKWAGVKKRIITKQDTMFHYLFAPKGMKYDRWNNKNATHIIAVSNESKEFIINVEKADPEKVKVIHHGVDEKEFTNAGEEEKNWIKNNFNPKNKILIGTVSRLVESKGYRYSIEAIEKVVAKRNDILFLAAGAGPDKDLLQKMINEKNLQNNIFLMGHIDKKYIPAFYQSLSIYIHSSIYEPFGFVIPEAIFNHVPLITTNTGASRDALIHMESAFFVENKNSDEIAAGIEFLLTDNRARSFAEKALAISREMYTLEKMWSGYKAEYLQ